MFELDLFLRGGAVALCLFLIFQLALSRLELSLRFAGIGFLAGVIGYSLVAVPDGPFAATLPIQFARVCPALFWWFALRIFDTRPPLLAVAAATLWLLAIPLLTGDPLSNVLHQITTVLLLGHVILVAFAGFSEDLVPARRHLRLFIGGLIPLVGLIIAWFESFPPPDSWVPWLHLLQSSGFVLLALGFAIWITALTDRLLPNPPPPPASSADKADLAKLTSAMADGIHKTEGLTIGALAERLELPEHRLRQLINRHMGYRNFSELLNDLRVDDAKALLADPAQARRQIAQIAYDAGYGSLATFNRAFRTRVGQSPSDFRRHALAFPD